MVSNDVFVNFAYPIERDDELVAYLRNELAVTSCGGVEARTRDNKFLDMAALFGPGYITKQVKARKLRDRTEMGASFLTYRADAGYKIVRTLPLVKLSAAMRRAGRSVQDRYMIECVIQRSFGRVHDIAAHRPVSAFPGRRENFDTHLKRRLRAIERIGKRRRKIGKRIRWTGPQTHFWMVRIDANENIFRYAKKIGGVAYGEGIRGIIVSPALAAHIERSYVQHAVSSKNRSGGRLTDHPVVGVIQRGVF